jgi:alpha-tubulin suppressor-like RCC1 family protein
MKRMLRLAMALLLVSCGFDRVVLDQAATDSVNKNDAGAPGAGGSVTVLSSEISAGWSQVCTINQGTAVCWGDYGWDESNGTSSHLQLSPLRMDSHAGYDSVAVGRHHACARRSTAVDCWGLNDKGQLGLGDEVERSAPALVASLEAISQVGVGYTHSCAISTTGQLWCWGSNDWGELGLSAFGTSNYAVLPQRIGNFADWQLVAGAQLHTCALRSPGSLWCWGVNDDGRLGLGWISNTPITDPTQVGTATDWLLLDGGQNDTCGIRRDGSLWCWGTGGFDNRQVLAPEQITSDFDWVSVSIDAFDRCAIKRDQSLWCWGRNVEGQLGLGDTTDRNQPTRVPNPAKCKAVSVGRFFVCAIDSDAGIWCAGDNAAGVLGQGDQIRRNTMTQVRP